MSKTLNQMPKTYFIMRKDLELPPGKLSGQVGHGVDMIWMNKDKNINVFDAWLDPEKGNRRKIVLSVKSLEQLNNIKASLIDDNYSVFDIVDAGLTLLAPNTVTGVVVFPTLNDENKRLSRLRVY